MEAWFVISSEGLGIEPAILTLRIGTGVWVWVCVWVGVLLSESGCKPAASHS